MSNTANAATQRSPTAAADEEDRLEKELLAEGVLDQIPASMTDVIVYQQWQPIPWQGKPISDTILEERR